ncbi:MAG TPA: glutamine--fructose-6-phosphate transaminase (isomerizing) [Nitrososphaeraceae archaeon]|jgi:glucosamine--fructose-6-phosphate aminotransferase (isomerizing)
MCSIIGYSGLEKVAPLLVGGLQKMEYRGYDSVGIATLSSGNLLIRKGIGKVSEVDRSCALKEMSGRMGIGHTRWATHGGIIDSNAHPHSGCTTRLAIVHNGIIENHEELKQELLKQGHVFKSQTDSEVIAHLLEHYWSTNNDIKQAMINTCNRLKGSFAFVAMFDNSTLCAARYDEPLIVGIAKEGYFISSDVLGFLDYTDRAIFLDNKDIVLLEGDKLSIVDFDGRNIERTATQVAWELAETDKGRYAYFTLKEIHEQISTIFKSMQQKPESIVTFCRLLTRAKDVFITGSGTSYNSALLAKHIFSKFSKLRVETVMSSEFQYSSDVLDENSVLIAISQSGETADVLQSVKAAREKGAKVLSIVNVTTSSLARLSDCYLEVKCGPEIGVAATKSFTSQLSILYTITDALGGNLTRISADRAQLSEAIARSLEAEQKIAELAAHIKDAKDIYILGRSSHFPICLEGALKIKELAYIHAEGIAAGELKHGPLALIDKNSVVIILNPDDSTYTDTLSNAYVVKSRGAKLIGITNKPNPIYDYCIPIPPIRESLLPLLEVIPLQILAYHLALYNNANPDYPRNLAKCVTVK